MVYNLKVHTAVQYVKLCTFTTHRMELQEGWLLQNNAFWVPSRYQEGKRSPTGRAIYTLTGFFLTSTTLPTPNFFF